MPPLPVNKLTQGQREQLAKEWAERRGYPIPQKPFNGWGPLLVIIGLFAGGIPGILLLIWLVIAYRDYRKQIHEMILQWSYYYERRRQSAW